MPFQKSDCQLASGLKYHQYLIKWLSFSNTTQIGKGKRLKSWLQFAANPLVKMAVPLLVLLSTHLTKICLNHQTGQYGSRMVWDRKKSWLLQPCSKLTLDVTSFEAVVRIKVCKSRKNSHYKVEFHIKGEEMCHMERRKVPEMHF